MEHGKNTLISNKSLKCNKKRVKRGWMPDIRGRCRKYTGIVLAKRAQRCEFGFQGQGRRSVLDDGDVKVAVEGGAGRRFLDADVGEDAGDEEVGDGVFAE